MTALEPSPCTRLAQSSALPADAETLALVPARTQDFVTVAAASPHPVLLHGETGSGKTHLARQIHQMSPRSGRPFVAVNCGAIPRELFEREMFGHVRGAFTGAADSRPGLFEAANGGTLFLDEIGELPLELQPKLLAVLDDGAVRRLGSTHEVRVDVRIISATNQDLAALVQARKFREDLFYRLCVLEYRVRSLRERQSEIPGLARDLLRRSAAPHAAACELSDEAMERICAYAWPGNIRELGNCLCQASVFAGGGTIEAHHLPERVRVYRPGGNAGGTGNGDPHGNGRRRYAAPQNPDQEREVILEALRMAGSNRTRAARRLGMSRSTLWAKLKLHRIA